MTSNEIFESRNKQFNEQINNILIDIININFINIINYYSIINYNFNIFHCVYIHIQKVY